MIASVSKQHNHIHAEWYGIANRHGMEWNVIVVSAAVHWLSIVFNQIEISSELTLSFVIWFANSFNSWFPTDCFHFEYQYHSTHLVSNTIGIFVSITSSDDSSKKQ